MKTRIFLFVILVCLWAGCTSSETTEGVRLEMKAVSRLATMNGRTDLTGLAFNEVLLGVEELEFELKDEGDHKGSNEDDDDGEGDNDRISGGREGHDGDHGGEGDDDSDDGEDDDGDEIEFEGAFIVDLIAGTSTPDFGLANVPPGLYEEIEIKLGPILPNGNTVFVAFTYLSVGGDTVQVEFSTKKELEIEIENDDGFQVEANVLNNILVLIDLDKLFAGIDLSQAEADENGIIRINDSSNAEIVKQVLSNLKGSCHAGEDNDYDDDIDDD